MNSVQKFRRETGQKIALVGLLLGGVFALGFGFIVVRSNIASPFYNQISHAGSASKEQAALDTPQEDSTVLKQRDTDSDGLSDYDEMYTYRTSPYLKDTDSDGYDDKKEIDTNHDPNCPEGKVCVATVSKNTGEGQQASSADVAGNLAKDLEKLKSLTPEQVRTLLKQKGFTDEQLISVDDTTLMSLYKQSLEQAAQQEAQKTQQAGGLQTTVPPSGQGTTKQQVNQQDFANMSKDQIIALLKETGQMTPDQLAQMQQVDEKTLRTLFLQALQNAQSSMDAKQGQ